MADFTNLKDFLAAEVPGAKLISGNSIEDLLENVRNELAGAPGCGHPECVAAWEAENKRKAVVDSAMITDEDLKAFTGDDFYGMAVSAVAGAQNALIQGRKDVAELRQTQAMLWLRLADHETDSPADVEEPTTDEWKQLVEARKEIRRVDQERAQLKRQVTRLEEDLRQTKATAVDLQAKLDDALKQDEAPETVD